MFLILTSGRVLIMEEQVNPIRSHSAMDFLVTLCWIFWRGSLMMTLSPVRTRAHKIFPILDRIGLYTNDHVRILPVICISLPSFYFPRFCFPFLCLRFFFLPWGWLRGVKRWLRWTYNRGCALLLSSEDGLFAAKNISLLSFLRFPSGYLHAPSQDKMDFFYRIIFMLRNNFWLWRTERALCMSLLFQQSCKSSKFVIRESMGWRMG